MADLIEREDAHNLINSLKQYMWSSPDRSEHRVTVDYDAVQFGLDKLPVVDTKPVVHARWIDTGSDYWERGRTSTRYKCSNCGRRAGEKQVRVYEHCPKCGAKMDGGEGI